MDLVLVCPPNVELDDETLDRLHEEGRRVLRSDLAPPGYRYECDLDVMSPVPDDWLVED